MQQNVMQQPDTPSILWGRNPDAGLLTWVMLQSTHTNMTFEQLAYHYPGFIDLRISRTKPTN
jgi:hypothetical protein